MQAPVDFNALFNTLAVDAPFAVHKHGAFYYDKYAAGLLQEHPFKGGPENMPERQSAALSLSTEEAATVAGDSFDIRTEFPHCKSSLTIFDQGSCGGCWALSTAGTLSDRFCAKGSDVVLSPQDLLDCVTGNSKGCSGGFTEDGFDYIADEGLRLNSCVPFTATDGFCGSSCSTRGGDDTLFHTTGWASYVPSDEESIKAELVKSGSISAVFEVFSDFFSYESGVYRHVSGDYEGLHAVVLAGWGTDDVGGDFWTVRNSWGEDFGESGYFRISRGLDNNGCNMEGGLTAGDPLL